MAWQDDPVVSPPDQAWQNDPIVGSTLPDNETLSDRIRKFLFEPEGAKVTREAIQGAVESIPQMALDTAKMGYKGLRMAMGGPEERVKILTEDVIPSALQQGQQTAEDIQSPFGTKEWLRGAGQMGMMALPGLELAREIRAPVEIPREISPVETPPVQVPPEPTLAQKIMQPLVEPPAPQEPLAPEAAAPPVTPVKSPEAAVLARRKGILARKAELTARAANGEQGLEPQLAAVEAELNDPVTNPVVHAPQPEAPAAAPPLDDLIKQVQSMPTNKYAGYDFTPEQIAEIEARQAAEQQPSGAGPPPTGIQLVSEEPVVIRYSENTKAISDKEGNIFATIKASKRRGSGQPFYEVKGHSKFAGKYPELEGVYEARGEQEAIDAAKEIANQASKPETATVPPAVEPPEPYTPEAAAARAAQPETTGISKAAIAGQREARELPAIERQKQIDFGESLDRAKATLAQDPMAGQRLVEELTAKPRSVTPEDTPLLIERMQQAQREFDTANRAVNEATPEQLEVAKARLEHARTEYDKTVTATQNATSRTGAGLNSVKMILNEDYSLARMESRKRAANNGSISPEQKTHTEALHASIAELSDRLDRLEKQRSTGFKASDVGKEATAARKSGKRLTDYTGEAAQRARERINRQLHGLGAKPAPPTLLYDYAVVGADHIARGLTKFSDWSAQMIREFGEKVKPHLQDLWKMARAVHDSTAKAFRTPEEARLERYKTGLAKQTVGVTAKIQRGDFTKATRQPLALDTAAFKMKGNLQRLKNEFERGVAKDAYNKMSPADKFWQHFVGVERAMKLSSPGVFEKLGIAAAVREVLAPVEAAGGYAAATFFPRLAKGTRYGADLKTIVRAEIKAKAALFTEGMKDSWENLKGKETGLEAMSDKYGRQPDFWYNRIGKIHAAVKAPIKRAEFVRSLEHRMDAAVKAGEDINHPEVMDRLATESALDANRAIFQQNTVVSNFFSMLDRAHPAAGRTARFLAPVVRIPVNLFKELVTYHAGAPVAAAKIGRAYWKGVETLPPVEREAIIRQLVKGSVGGAGLLWGYFNRDKAHDFFASVPPGFEHTPIAMAIHEGSIIKGLEEQGTGTRYRPTEAWKEASRMAKYDIPFAYTITGLTDVVSDPDGWRKYLYGMIQSSVVPQVSSWTAKEMDKPTPFNIFDKPTYRQPRNIVEAITQGIPGLREDIPEYQPKRRGH